MRVIRINFTFIRMQFAEGSLALRTPALLNCLAPAGDYRPRASPFHGRQRKNVSRWFKCYRESMGIGNTFHSFRHTFSDELKQALVNPHVIDELTGHAISSVTMGIYGKPFGVDILKEFIEKIPTIKGI